MSAVTFELEGHVATITYNRPEALNAIDCSLYKKRFQAREAANTNVVSYR